MMFDTTDAFFKGIQGRWFHYGLWEMVPLCYFERDETFLDVCFGFYRDVVGQRVAVTWRLSLWDEVAVEIQGNQTVYAFV